MADALALTTGELVGVAVAVVGGEADQPEQLDDTGRRRSFDCFVAGSR